MKNKTISNSKALALLGLSAAVYITPTVTPLGQAHASGALVFRITDEVTVNECNDCHVPYDPGLLTKGAWKRVMADLSNHFGENASLPEDTRQHIENYLVANARRGDGPERITDQRWFKGVHRGMSYFSTWFGNGEQVVMSNCGSCHGIYNAAAR